MNKIQGLIIFSLMFFVANANATYSDSLSLVPPNEVVTGYSSITKKYESRRYDNTTSNITACKQWVGKGGYVDSNFTPPKTGIYPINWYVSGNSSTSSCPSAQGVQIRHLSSFSSTSNACMNNYNRSDLLSSNAIVSEISTSTSCENSKVAVLRKLSASTTSTDMCPDFSDLPTGWAVTRIDRSLNCGTLSTTQNNLRWQIQQIPASGTIDACRLPADMSSYSYTLVSSSSTICGGGPRYRVGVAIDGAIACRVPTGMVASEVRNDANCSSGTAYVIRTPANNLTMCKLGNAKAPSGFVVNTVGSSSSCQSSFGNTTWKIMAPAAGVISCKATSDLPVGFGYKNERYYSQCGGSSSVVNGYELTGTITDGTSFCGNMRPTLPAGLVFTSVSNITACGGTVYRIEAPSTSSSTNICYFSDVQGPIPSGFVITNNRTAQTTCTSGTPLVIRAVASNLWVCSRQNVPSNYIYTDISSTYADCTSSALRISATTSDTYYVCELTVVPPGYFLTDKPAMSDCPSGKGYRLDRIPLTGTVNVCASDMNIQAMPTGMVVLEKVTGSSCDSAPNYKYKMGYPNASGTTIICYDRLPPGYRKTGSGIYPRCNDSMGWEIMPDNAGGGTEPAVSVTPFVNGEPDFAPDAVPTIQYRCNDAPITGGFVSGASSNGSCP